MRQQVRRATTWCAALLALGASAAPVTVGAVTPAATADPRHRPVFRWPVDGTPRPVRHFDPPPQPWRAGHRGVDLAAAPGSTVRAAGPGTVLFAGPVAGRPVITVGHGAGLRTTYEPVRPDVRPGDAVPAGAPLGVLLAGHAGCPVAGCLHWGLRRDAEYLDPLALLRLGPVRLLPVDADPVSGPYPAAGTRPASRVPSFTPGWSVAPGWGDRPRATGCRCGHRRARTRSAPGEQRGQAGGQPLVLVGRVVDLAAEP
ncbi:murein hydrolase activator EnvC [Micromonospora sp. KC723]|uniref:murein hydrolase activator EnvC family protein n=1 Tax=Micromonospora sp. KC723 TaxID=2530381 RepID=UPI00104780F9|nr:M23 family metallopeptidase [Micromonospora sp. KC723]